MLKIIASFSKKVPAEQEYSSQQYFCTLEREVPDSASVEQIHDHIHATFSLVKQAVEDELSGKKPENADLRVLPTSDSAPKAETKEKASNRQVKYILDLAKGKGLGIAAINERVHQKFGVESVYALDRKSASKLVDELKAAA